MSKKKLFTDRRWTDPPIPTVIGHHESTEEERKQADKDFEKLLKEVGAMKPDESIEDWEDWEDIKKDIIWLSQTKYGTNENRRNEMANDDMEVIIYKILQYLYSCMKHDVAPDLEKYGWHSDLMDIPQQYQYKIIK